MTPIVQEVLRTAGRRGAIDPEAAARMIQSLRAGGPPAHKLPLDTINAVSRVVGELGANGLPAMIAAMQQPDGEPPPEVKELIRRLGEELRVPEGGTTEDIIAHMTGKMSKPGP